MITGGQMKAARALLGIDQKQLAELAGLSVPTIQRMEASEGTVRGVVESLTRVVEALSRAGVVDFAALMASVKSGHILAASDVFPEEPLAKDHPVRTLPGFLRSAHRAGALDVAFKRMGDMVLEDMDLVDRGLPPLRSKRAERETVSRMRSKPVDRN